MGQVRLPPPPRIDESNQSPQDWLVFNSFLLALYAKIEELEERIKELEG